MVAFVRGRTVGTTDPRVVVDAGLAVGTHRFQLVVVSSSGRRSAPQLVDVVVSRPVIVQPQPPVTIRPPVTPIVTPVVTPVVRPRGRAAAEASATRAPASTRPAKPRSEK